MYYCSIGTISINKPFRFTTLFWIRWIAILLSVFIIFNNHSKTDFKSYHGTLWADAAGYYHYLPATFKYGYEADKWPENAENRIGNGFEVQDGKIVSKYFIGSAILNVPAYFVAETFSSEDSEYVGGFDETHQYMVLFSTLIYVFLGLYFLEKIWSHYLKKETLYFLIPIMYMSTNLLYYTVDKGGMTHGQSFFLFCLAWYGLHKFSKGEKSWFYVFAGATSLAVLIRPTALMAVPFFYLVLTNHEASIKENVVFWMKRIGLVLAHAAIMILTFIPQLLYWKYASGSYFNYAYGDEGFDFLNPHILEVLFSPNNGLLIYTPLILLFILAFFKKDGRANLGLNTFVFFLLLLYVFSCWKSWAYGCSLGQRSFIEYYPILAFPLFIFIDKLDIWDRKSYRISAITVLLICNILQVKYVYVYDDCFYAGDWDYGAWLNILQS